MDSHFHASKRGLIAGFRVVTIILLTALSSATAWAQSCGTAAGRPALVAPTTNKCIGLGVTASAVTGTGPFSWTCTSIFNSTVSCSAPAHCHDLDGDGQIHATTDGLMLNRIMLGQTGTAVASAAEPGSPRNTWPLIRDYLNANCGYSFAVPPPVCIATGQTLTIAPQTSITNCINAIIPAAAAATGCCVGTLTVIVYDNPIGSNSCSGQCGAPIGGTPPLVGVH